MMQITCEKNGSELIVAVVGRLDTQAAPELEKALEDNLSGATSLTFDLAGLTYVSSAGLRVFLKARKFMKQRDSIRLLHVCENVMEIFEMAGFTELMTIDNN